MNDDTTYNVVNDILKDYPKTRNDDFLLCSHVLVRLGYAHKGEDRISFRYKNIEYAPVFETITRIRRKIQNKERRYQPNEETMVKRAKHQTRMHNKYSNPNLLNTKPISQNNAPNSWMLP
jgi:hypothetical protein